jgi:hypothetical protein
MGYWSMCHKTKRGAGPVHCKKATTFLVFDEPTFVCVEQPRRGEIWVENAFMNGHQSPVGTKYW